MIDPILRDEARNMTREIAVLHAVAMLGHLPKIIVETGTGRGPEMFGTVYLGDIAKRSGGRLVTVDLDPQVTAYAKREAPADLHGAIEFVTMDSRAYFASLPSPKGIELLFLDSAYDAALILSEAEAAMHHLADECAVVIDDCERGKAGERGKGTLAIPYLQSLGFRVKYFSGGKKTVAVLWRTA